MKKIGYHVFKKPKKTREGKKFFRWYYYFYDLDGKKVQRACVKCQNRSDAESYIRTLPPLPRAGHNPDILVKTIAENMFIPGSAHIDRRRQLGKSIVPETLIDARRFIDSIIAKWGDRPLDSLGADEITDHLFSIQRSGSWKKRYLSILKEIYIEAPRYGCHAQKPEFPNFARNSKKANIFTTPELTQLFKPENFPDFQFFLFFLLSLSAGLRMGEARAIRLKQIFFLKKALIIDGFCKNDGTRTNYNKKGTPDNPKLRVVKLPDFTLSKINDFLKDKNIGPDDFLFTYSGKPFRKELAENVFVRALIKAGIARDTASMKEAGIWHKGKVIKKADIIPDGRKLVPHSLRYTYVSRMRRELSAEDLQPMTGHTTPEMVDYYNQTILTEALASLPEANSALKNLLDF